ncbi:uncharacterized protein LOC133850358 isoform X2 [Drosophila sulfurigaster albostrigata]|uniref:uncharacterized protein LOC133850358 isoform X2 n=2 Tax=Drosophila sulfurigaster albostrigata TaxID=89887 RepID=UPI002D21C03C|nr:uncharacterized protein LOC133850358 isoform X2 [Drosophila sulfurigaster albostrigata]
MMCLPHRYICAPLALLLITLILNVAARPQHNLQHIAVLENAAWEQTLPPHFQNPFYQSPRVRQALAKSSWFGPGEQVVHERQAEKIPRMEIYNVLSHAGLLPRRHYF